MDTLNELVQEMREVYLPPVVERMVRLTEVHLSAGAVVRVVDSSGDVL